MRAQEMFLIRVFISHPAPSNRGLAAQGEQRQIGVDTKEINVRENSLDANNTMLSGPETGPG